jgi:hypothetical protein
MRGKALVVLALAALLTPLAALPAPAATYCFGMPATIIVAVPGVVTYGTAGDDVIVGTEGDDIIRGGLGKDRICGLGGNDDLRGGAGRDRISGGEGDDVIWGNAGSNQLLKGDGGNDTIRADGSEDEIRGGLGDDVLKAYGPGTVYGGPGADILQSFAAFVALYGEGGNDRIRSSYRNDLDAGPGFDRCYLDMTVPGTGCERVTLLCGSGGDPLPAEPPEELSNASGDFDGNGVDDTLYVWKDGSQWIAHIETDGGFGAEIVLPTDELIPAKAIGGYDVNGDGIDEAFIKVDAGASSDIVGIYTLWEAVGSPTTGFSCALRPVSFFPHEEAKASFVIDAGINQQTGLQCRADHTLREYNQETVDQIAYTQHRYDYVYSASFGTSYPMLWNNATTQVDLLWPADQTLINLAGQFTCGTLSLYP